MARNPQLDERLGDYTADARLITLSGMAALVGVISAFVALALVRLIGLFTNLAYFHRFATSLVSPAASGPGLWSVPIPVVGGLIVGLLARYGSEKIRGHGIPEAMEAILIGRSRIEARVAVLKPLSSTIAIGTGGPFGAEGPIIATGGAFGSVFAQAFHLSPVERKTLLVAGAAAGMAAIFAAPVAAVLLAVELLLFEWKPRSFIPVACTVAMAAALGRTSPSHRTTCSPRRRSPSASGSGWSRASPGRSLRTCCTPSRTDSHACPSIGCGGPPSRAWSWGSAGSSRRGPSASVTT